MHWLMPALSCFLLLAAAPTSASAEPRLALVIANGAYGDDLPPLANPVSDGKLIAATLRKLGFKVTLVSDIDQKGMKRAISEFGDALGDAGPTTSALFYYAGHGLQVDGQNYLVPINAAINKEADVDLEAVSAETVLKQMEYAAPSTSIVILDACRNNPLSRGFRTATRGLARMDAPNGSYVAYSTAPGQTAADGTGKNSPFATALAAEIVKPGQGIEESFRNVRVNVSKATNGEQTPWDSSSLMSSFYFAGEARQVAIVAPEPAPTPQVAAVTPSAPAPATSAAEPTAAEMAFWDSIKNSTSANDYAAYLDEYPGGSFAKLAASRRSELEAKAASRAAAQSTAGSDSTQVAALISAPEPVFESPLPDGTIILSPSVAAQLDGYLKVNGAIMSVFFVSEDGLSAGSEICTINNCFLSNQRNMSQGVKISKLMSFTKQKCETSAKSPCVLLFSMFNQKRDYKVFGQQ